MLNQSSPLEGIEAGYGTECNTVTVQRSDHDDIDRFLSSSSSSRSSGQVLVVGKGGGGGGVEENRKGEGC